MSMCITGKGRAAGQKALAARCSMTTESLPPEKSSTGSLEPGRYLPDDVDRLRLQGAQVGKFVGGRHQLGFSWAAQSPPEI